MEEYQASEDMKKFFQGLLELKQFIKDSVEKTSDPIILEIYVKLNLLIKSAEETK